MVKERKEAGVIRQYHPSLNSRLKSKLFRTKHRKQFESALYRVGRDEKSIFWYWEIDYESGHYRHFWTIELAEGEKRFREEDFGSWPKLDNE